MWPSPLSSLVGRSQLLERARAVLADEHARLLTLTGPGGVGKTRLLLALLDDVAPDFDGHAYWVDLSPLDTASRVLSTIAHALGIVVEADQGALARIAQVQQRQSTLLAVDNFEHVIGAADDLGALLERCPGLTCVVTSRESLRLRGEHELPVPPLQLPDASASADTAAASDALALFTARARSIEPSFRVDDSNLHAVLQLCRAVDGLPLGLELAAARVKAVPPAALAARLSQRLDLVARARDLPARHRSLRAAIGWSDDLLSEAERAAFHALAVCVGGFDLDAATAIVGPAADQLVESLVDKSLVQRDSARYTMLETIREFALEQLEAAPGQAAAAHAGHARHYVVFAVRTARELQGARQRAALRDLLTDYDNLRAALRWLLRSEPETVARTAGALWLFWSLIGELGAGAAWMEQALEAPLPDDARAHAILLRGLWKLQRGDPTAIADLDTAQRLFVAVDDRSGVARALLFAGRAEESRAAFAEVGDLAGEALALTAVAELAIGSGSLMAAEEAYTRSLERARAVDDDRAVAHALDGLGLVALLRGEAERARPLVSESARLCLDIGHAGGVWFPLLDLAAVLMASGDALRAARVFGAAEAVRARQGAVVSAEHAPIFKRVSSGLRTVLSGVALAEAVADGARLPLADVVTEATRRPRAATDLSSEPSALTTREREVASLIGRGLTSRQIAEVLVITERTADTHAERIRGKLGLRSRAEIAAWATRHGLVDDGT